MFTCHGDLLSTIRLVFRKTICLLVFFHPVLTTALLFRQLCVIWFHWIMDFSSDPAGFASCHNENFTATVWKFSKLFTYVVTTSPGLCMSISFACKSAKAGLTCHKLSLGIQSHPFTDRILIACKETCNGLIGAWDYGIFIAFKILVVRACVRLFALCLKLLFFSQ